MDHIAQHIFSGVISKHETDMGAVSQALEWKNGIVFDESGLPVLIIFKGIRFAPSLTAEAKVFRLLTVLKHISATNAEAYGTPEMALNMLKELAANVVKQEAL